MAEFFGFLGRESEEGIFGIGYSGSGGCQGVWGADGGWRDGD